MPTVNGVCLKIYYYIINSRIVNNILNNNIHNIYTRLTLCASTDRFRECAA